MKRFYRMVTRQHKPEGWEIHLDGKPVRMPSGRVLVAPDPDFADALVSEWAAQDTEIVPDSMPLTQILTTARDRVAHDRSLIAAEVMAYLDTDLLCYRAPHPAVGEKQAKAWNPWLSWFGEFYGVTLETTQGLAALAQGPSAHGAVQADMDSMDDLSFTILQLVTALAGSLVLALAFIHGAADAEQVLAASHVEEDHKAEIYNEALHGLAPQEEKRRMAMRRDLDAAQKIRDFLRNSRP